MSNASTIEQDRAEVVEAGPRPRRRRRSQAERDKGVDYATLPVLTTARVAILAGCDRSTVARSPLVPVGRRGKTKMYRTADVLRWVAGELESNSQDQPATPPMRTRATTTPSDVTDRLAAIRRGDR